jgi:hypothetical protein
MGMTFFFFVCHGLKIKLVLKYEMTFEIVTEKSIDGKYN